MNSLNENDKVWDQFLAKVNADIKDHGWHLVYLKGNETSPGFCFTIGLMETYQHPEILLFAPSDGIDGLMPALKPIVAEIAAGKAFKDGDNLPNAFNRIPGTFRKVLPLYLSTFMDSALSYYNQANVETLQLFWSDANNNYPWHSDFSPSLITHQPALFQDNLFLAGLSYEGCMRVLEGGSEPLAESLKRVLVDASKLAAKGFLDTWEPQLGTDCKLQTVTVFGDPLILRPDGTVDWLDTSNGEVKPLAWNAKELVFALLKQADSFFYRSVYLHANAAGFEPKPGEVFCWRHYPFLGGAFHLDNLDTVGVEVHLQLSGKLFNEAAAVADFRKDDGLVYEVIINQKKEYSILPEGENPTEGWEKVGKKGSKPEVMDYLENFLSGS